MISVKGTPFDEEQDDFNLWLCNKTTDRNLSCYKLEFDTEFCFN